jgi:glycine/D-amino acid oxidase-like deaminating enzyme
MALSRSAAKPKTAAKRDLRTGRPVWLASRMPPTAHERPGRLTSADVVIIGGGVSGALVADALLQAGRQVVVFDRRGPVKGSTAASTALLQFEIDTPLIKLRSKIGTEKAHRAYWRSAMAVDYIRHRIGELEIACDFVERETLYLCGDVLGARELQREVAARQSIGLRSVYLNRANLKEIGGIDRAGASLSQGSAELDPVKLVAALWRSVAARGGRIFAPIEVTDLHASRLGVEIMLANEQSIRAKAVVVATGYEMPAFLTFKQPKVISTWAMATKPQASRLWPEKRLIWEAADPYLYCRTTTDGRVIAGGEDEDFSDEETRDQMLPKKIAAISRKLTTLFPHLDTMPAFSWAGCFGQTTTGLPIIGDLPGMPRCSIVMGYGGNGITFSAIAAQMIQRKICGVADPDEDLFSR